MIMLTNSDPIIQLLMVIKLYLFANKGASSGPAGGSRSEEPGSTLPGSTASNKIDRENNPKRL